MRDRQADWRQQQTAELVSEDQGLPRKPRRSLIPLAAVAGFVAYVATGVLIITLGVVLDRPGGVLSALAVALAFAAYFLLSVQGLEWMHGEGAEGSRRRG